jgi:ABC-type branched-subunit amino acid transport system permease subunit
MEVLGYDTWRYKYVAFVLAGVVAGASGNLFVYYNGFVSPAYLSIVFSAMALIMVILGGAGTLLGPRWAPAPSMPSRTSSAPTPSAGSPCSASSTWR